MEAIPDLEAALLGACIMNPTHLPLLTDAAELLTHHNRTLAEGLLATCSNGATPDMTLLRTHLGPDWDKIGGHAYVSDLCAGVTSAANAPPAILSENLLANSICSK